MPVQRPSLRTLRDVALFLLGAFGVLWETVWEPDHPDPTLLILFAAMLGLPVLLRSDEHHDPPDKEDKG